MSIWSSKTSTQGWRKWVKDRVDEVELLVLSDLTDVNTSTPTNRNVLVADGTDFESRALVEADISDLHTPGITVQIVNVQDGAVATGTTILPHDDTRPQNNEGIEVMTLAITPNNTANLLRIDIVANYSSSGQNQRMVCALFQESTADAIAAVGGGYDGNVVQAPQPAIFTHWMTAGTTSSTTFKVRCGAPLAGTTTFNGFNGLRTLGGVHASSITITEYLP